MKLIDGKKIAAEVLAEAQAGISRLNFTPILCDIVVGEDPVSLSYVKIKQRTAEKIGVKFLLKIFPADINEKELLNFIEEFSGKPNMAGIILQLPLPAHLSAQKCLDAIPQHLDVDCLSSESALRFYRQGGECAPPAAAAALRVLQSLGLPLKEKKFLVVGQGIMVGRPLAFLLKSMGIEPVVADSSVSNLALYTKAADVIFSATGKKGLIKSEMCRNDAVIIDAGTSESGGEVFGDADLETFKNTNCQITPVPGGVGPVTVSMLMINLLKKIKNPAV